MSRELVQTRLFGRIVKLPYDGPVAVSTQGLQDVLNHAETSTRPFFEKACENIPGYLESFSPTTEDGYGWFLGCRFKTNTGEIAVLIPRTEVGEKRDGSPADRSVAVYKRRSVAESEIELILHQFAASMAALKREYVAIMSAPQEKGLRWDHGLRP